MRREKEKEKERKRERERERRRKKKRRVNSFKGFACEESLANKKKH